jgi:predicted ATPase
VLFGAVASLLSAAAARQPVVLVLDDIQWADTATALLLHHLLAVPSRPRLLVIATYRVTDVPEGSELSAALGRLRRDERVEELRLSGLREGDVLDLVQELAGGGVGERERAYARALHRETDGNPLFVSEVLREGVSDEPSAPPSLRELIAARAAGLGAEALAVLEAASVVGREFDARLLARVAELDGERIADVLDRAERAALVIPVEGRPGRLPGAPSPACGRGARGARRPADRGRRRRDRAPLGGGEPARPRAGAPLRGARRAARAPGDRSRGRAALARAGA